MELEKFDDLDGGCGGLTSETRGHFGATPGHTK